MSQYYLFQDTKKCIGCHSCEIQCKTNKSLPVGPKPCQIVTVGPRFIGGLPRTSFIFMPCFHCENPWCVAACPTGAMQKRPEDGIVFIDESVCVGCKACIAACPWGAPQWNRETKKVVKCDYCKDRLDQGRKPACVTICTTQCLHFGLAENITQIRRERHAHQIADTELYETPRFAGVKSNLPVSLRSEKPKRKRGQKCDKPPVPSTPSS